MSWRGCLYLCIFFLEQEGYGNSAQALNFSKNKVRGFEKAAEIKTV